MTIIAYRDGVLAADTAMFNGSLIGSLCKIARNGDGDLAGAAGLASYAFAFLVWFTKGERGKPPKATRDADNYDRGVIFRRTGEIEVFESDGNFTMSAPYYALGCGRSEALGAMWVGATAEEAVKAAIALDPHCGGEVTVLRHLKAKKARKR